MPDIKISFDEDAVLNGVSRVLKRKIEHTMGIETLSEVAGEYASAIAKYVPYKTGELLNSADIVGTLDGVAIRYSAKSKNGYDYAKVQYETPFENRTTPDTYDHWNRHLTTAERQKFYEKCAEIISESMRNG